MSHEERFAREDDELMQVMNGRSHSMTTESPVTDDMEHKMHDASPKFIDRLWSCAKPAIFCGLYIMFFCWENAGLMDSSIAVPCMSVCALLAGFGIGKNSAKRNRR